MPTSLLVILSVIAGALGNVLIKMGTKTIPTTLSLETLKSVLLNPPLLIGIFFMAAMFPVYALALQRMSLSVAFPLITSSQFLLVVIISYFVFHESLTFVNFLGILLLVVGLFLVAHR